VRKITVVVAMILGIGLICPSINLLAAEPIIDPGAEDYWNMMAQKAEKEAKEEAEKEKKEKKTHLKIPPLPPLIGSKTAPVIRSRI